MAINKQTQGNEAVRKQLYSFFTALTFLTILPISFGGKEEKNHFTLALYYFPLIGLIIGIFLCLLCYPLSFFLPSPVISALAVAFLAGISGFLHFDGLSDSFDGLFSCRDKERSLEIMRDSRIGAMGLAGVLCVVLIKFSACISISPNQFYQVFLITPLAGRVAVVVAMATQKYARPGGGLGRLFYSSECKKAAGLALVFLFIVVGIIHSLLLSLILLVSLILIVFGFGYFCKVRLGGATGDTFGATIELTEMAVLVLFTALPG